MSRAGPSEETKVGTTKTDGQTVKINRINRFLNSPVAGAQIEPELTEQPSTSEYTGDIIPLGANSCTW